LPTLRSQLNLPASVSVDERQQILTAGQGLLTQNYERQASSANQIMIDGTVYFMLVGLRAGDVVSSISVTVAVIGVTPTVSKVGLYSKAGIQLAASAELGAVWTTAVGTKTSAVTAPYPVLTDDVYYVALICKAGTLPTLTRGAANASYSTIGSGAAPIGTQASQTDLPAPATIITSGTPFGFWVGVS
jgi:hypothetical protein